MQATTEASTNLNAAGQVLNLFIDPSIPGKTPFSKVKQKAFSFDRYEFLVYRLLRNALEAGNVYVRDSNDFRSFEDDLIDARRWKDKEAVLREIGAPILLAPIQETLAVFQEELEGKFPPVNEPRAKESRSAQPIRPSSGIDRVMPRRIGSSLPISRSVRRIRPPACPTPSLSSARLGQRNSPSAAVTELLCAEPSGGIAGRRRRA